LEWIPYNCIGDRTYGTEFNGLPTDIYGKLIPLEINDRTDDVYYAKVKTISICVISIE